MSVMPISVRPVRALLMPDISHTSISPLALQHDEIDSHTETAYTASGDSFSHDSPRFPTVGTERESSYPRLYYPETEDLSSSGVSNSQAHPGSSAPHVPRTSPSDLSGDDFDSVQTNLAGPIRIVKSHSRRQPPGHIPRPRNAFILYRSWYVRQGFLADVENDHREISRIVGKIWKSMTDDEKAPWKDLAEKEKLEHAQKYPNYKYSPNSRRDAASPPSRNPPARSSASRSRKTKAAHSPTDRIDDIAGVFASGSRKLSLATVVREKDELREEEPEATTKPSSPVLKIRVPPPNRAFSESQRPGTPQPGTPLADSPHDPSSFEPQSTPEEKPKLELPGMLPTVEYQPSDDSSWSLVACSAPFPDSGFSPESDASFVLSECDYYDSELLPTWALRPGFDGGETLNAIMTCNDLTTEFRLPKVSTDNSDLYYPGSPAATSQHFTTSKSELSPFDRIALEGTQEGHPGAPSFDTPAWGGLFQTSAGSSMLRDANSSSSSSSDLSSQSYSIPEDSCLSCTDVHSLASEVCLCQPHRDYGLFSEWCNPDSPIVAENSEYSVQTPASASSSGAPSSPLPLAYPAPTNPNKLSDLLNNFSWGNAYEDLDAYEHAAGGIKAELDDHGIFFGADGLVGTEGQRA